MGIEASGALTTEFIDGFKQPEESGLMPALTGMVGSIQSDFQGVSELVWGGTRCFRGRVGIDKLEKFMRHIQRLIAAVLLVWVVCFMASSGIAATDCGGLPAHDCQLREARALKVRYLGNLQFLESLPEIQGRAERVSGKRLIKRNLSGPTRITGSARIDRLVGGMRLKLTSTREVLQYGKEARVEGTVTVDSGRLRIYSPVDVDFWQMAGLFMDKPVRNVSTPAELKLEGWQAIDVSPGIPTRFSATLVALAGDHVLMIDAVDGEATGVVFELTSP